MSTIPAPSPVQIRNAWDAVADGFDRHVTPHSMGFGEQVLAALPLGPGVRVLDVGAGSGALAIPAARTGAEVVAVDIAPIMIERLATRSHAEELDNLDARVADGTALDLDDDSFDVAVSLNGVSVFPDLSRGLTEMARVTRPGGQVVVAAFGPLPEVEFVAFFLGALRAVAPDAVPPPTQPLPPFRLADPTIFQRTMEEAGLHDVAIETATWETTAFGSFDDHLAVMMSSNPIAGQLVAGLTDEQLEQFRLVLDGMLRERSGGDGGITLRSTMRIGHATL
jgi:ubiquinone/menaquinone biosynthesis C-methylase UbiE